MTVPNQKEVQVAKRTPRDGNHLYSMNNLDALRQAMNCLKGSGLKMWLYLNKNQDKRKGMKTHEKDNFINISNFFLV